MKEEVTSRKEAVQGRRVAKEQLDKIQVAGSPDPERMVAALEWLLYRRGPLARSIRRIG